MKTKKRKIIELNLGIIVVVIAITVIAIMMLKYHVEGEKDMPYVLNQMLIISTANGTNTPEEEYKWNINIYQNTDIYFDIQRNNKYKSNENLKSVKIDNIQITQKGKYETRVYMPSIDGEEVFNYTDENLAKEKIEYTIDKNKNIKERKITSEGGIVALSFASLNIGTYKGNDDKMSYDGTLLGKIGVTNEDIVSEVKFNLIIETESQKNYKAEINLTLPPEDIVNEGIITIKDTELQNIVFKRI